MAKLSKEEKQEKLNEELIDAISIGTLDEIKAIIKKGAELDCTNHENEDILVLACMEDRLDVVKYLVEDEELDRDETNWDFSEAFVEASGYGHLEIVKYLNQFENINVDMGFIDAALNGNKDVVEYLYDYLDSSDDADRYSLKMACKGNHKEVVKYLIEQGVNVNEAIESCSQDVNLEMIKYMVEQGVDIDDVLIIASREGSVEIVKYCVENGANVNVWDDMGITEASHNGHLEIVKYLHQNGADLDIAVEKSHDLIKEELISYKEKILLSDDLKEVKQEQQKPKNTMRI